VLFGTLVAYGEENRDWGGAFAVYRGLTEALPYHRLFNSPISEGAIVGTAVARFSTTSAIKTLSRYDAPVSGRTPALRQKHRDQLMQLAMLPWWHHSPFDCLLWPFTASANR